MARGSQHVRIVVRLDFATSVDLAPTDHDQRSEATRAVQPVTDAAPILPDASVAIELTSNEGVAKNLQQEFVARSALFSTNRMPPRDTIGNRSDCMAPIYRPAGFLTPTVELRRRGLYPLVAQSACRHQLPIALYDALIIQESGYNRVARSPVGAFGLAQLMPATALELGSDRFLIASNLDGGARY